MTVREQRVVNPFETIFGQQLDQFAVCSLNVLASRRAKVIGERHEFMDPLRIGNPKLW